MTAKEFEYHLYRNTWKYIIQEVEYKKYLRGSLFPDVFPDEFISSVIPDFLKALNREFPFYEAYQEVIGAIDTDVRDIIIEFMIWYKENEAKSSKEIFEEYHSESGFDEGPLKKLVSYVKTITLMDEAIPERYIEESNTIIFNVIERFTSAAKSLQERRAGEPTIEMKNEYDVQDILFVMLKPHFPSLRIEEVVAGKDSEKFLKIDFLVTSEKVAIEVKYIRDNNHARSITKEINDDIQTYHKHQDCNHLIFFVYDKALLLKNPDILEDEYSKTQIFDGKEMRIDLRVRPKN